MFSPLLLIVFLKLISIDIVVEGAECQKAKFGNVTCNHCGEGTRCNLCTFCTAYCYNGHTHTRTKSDVKGIVYGSVEGPYKIPFLEMFNDIDVLLNIDGISDYDVVDLYKRTSVLTREDCIICNNSPELNSLSIFTDNVHLELEKLIGSLQFKLKAIERTTQTKIMVQNLPDSLKFKVEPMSSILENIKKGKQKDLILNLKSAMIIKCYFSCSDNWLKVC